MIFLPTEPFEKRDQQIFQENVFSFHPNNEHCLPACELKEPSECECNPKLSFIHLNFNKIEKVINIGYVKVDLSLIWWLNCSVNFENRSIPIIRFTVNTYQKVSSGDVSNYEINTPCTFLDPLITLFQILNLGRWPK